MTTLVASTPFRKMAHDLVSPLAERFDPRPWGDAFSQCETVAQDKELLRSALWVGESARALYGSMPNRFSRMDRTDAMVLGIATINGHYRRISTDARAAAREASDRGAQSFDALVNTRMSNDSGLSLPSSDFVETMVDAMDAWLFDAARTKGDSFDPSKVGEIEQISSELVSYYTMRCVLKRLWDRALYQGYRLDEDLTWAPPNRMLAELHQGWLARNDAVFMASPAHLMTVWRDLEPAQRRKIGLQKTVTSARDVGNEVRLKVERSTYRGKRAPLQVLNKAGLKDSYLAPFLAEPFPLFPDLTVELLDDAWWVCEAAARAITKLTHSRERGRSGGLYANAVDIDELARAIAKSLGTENGIARQIIGFLTYSEQPKTPKGEARADDTHGWRGLWSAPLVGLEGYDLVLLPTAVFQHSAPLYRAEAWLEKGGLGDQGLDEESRSRGGRGVRFEEFYREQLVEAVSANDLLRETVVAPRGVRKQVPAEGRDSFGEQIDVLIKLGNRLLVGELKFLLTPDDPHRWERFYDSLDHAAEQAKRKADALSYRPDLIASELGIDEDEVRELPITPIVIVNGGFGFSLNVRSCRVVDGMFLRDYLKSQSFSTGGAFDGRRVMREEVTMLYFSEREASDRFDPIMAQPPGLRKFIDRLTWDTVEYTSRFGESFRIRRPFRGDVTALERMKRRGLLEGLF